MTSSDLYISPLLSSFFFLSYLFFLQVLRQNLESLSLFARLPSSTHRRSSACLLPTAVVCLLSSASRLIMRYFVRYYLSYRYFFITRFTIIIDCFCIIKKIDHRIIYNNINTISNEWALKPNKKLQFSYLFNTGKNPKS